MIGDRGSLDIQCARRFRPVRVAVTLGAFLALVRAGINPRDLAQASSGPDGPAHGETAEALGLRVVKAYRLSDGEKVWLICEQEG